MLAGALLGVMLFDAEPTAAADDAESSDVVAISNADDETSATIDANNARRARTFLTGRRRFFPESRFF